MLGFHLGGNTAYLVRRILDLMTIFHCRSASGKGVDVILDCVGGSYWEKNSQAIATEGRWVLFGLMGRYTFNPFNAEATFIQRIMT